MPSAWRCRDGSWRRWRTRSARRSTRWRASRAPAEGAPAGCSREEAARRLGIMETQLGPRHRDHHPAPRSDPPVPASRPGRRRTARAEAIDLVRPGMAAARVTVEVNSDEALPHVRGHAGQLQQVILNLLTNAMDATPPGGARRGGDASRPRARRGRSSRSATADMGSRRRSASTSSSRSSPPRRPGGGRASGCPSPPQIVREHKGAIEVESEPGRGSTFRVVAARRWSQRMTSAPATFSSPTTIRSPLELLGEVLRPKGYRVRAAAGGEECVRLAGGRAHRSGVVDLRMPDVGRRRRCSRRLASIQPGIPGLILTAFANIDRAIEAIREGAYDYLSKPFRMEEVELVVRRDAGSAAAGARECAVPPRRCETATAAEHGRPIAADAGGLQARGARGVARHHGAHRGRDGHRQGAGGARHPPRGPARPRARSSSSTAPRCPRRCSSRSCSATSAARSPARVVAARPVRDGGRRHAASSTRSASCRRRCRPSCCARCRSAPSGASAATTDPRERARSSRPRTAISGSAWRRARSARTSTIGSTS